ncbi:unnamed protein product [Heligmosomoides polygyrus]|uniref:Transmembrane gamma-carboxyglutamic acid protein 4 n=1 Tax=Heligmosomoides polygyrus TaxID=6339 RepID=A0A183G3Z8_HELPZ|nr:unnamed protein product [Heligmosomoides polygyrus]
MPFEFLMTNHNITQDDLEKFEEMAAEEPERWTREEVQIVVLLALLLVIIFAVIALASLECFRQKWLKCCSPIRLMDAMKAPTMTAISEEASPHPTSPPPPPPPYTPSERPVVFSIKG